MSDKNKRKKLKIQQLVALEQKVFTDDSLNTIKELFLTSCCTGFAFADIMELRQSHFEWDTDGTVWCKLYRLKTDNLSPVPVLKSASTIINKYKQHPHSIERGTVFPAFTNQHVNRCLKIIKEACEFDIPLTFHIARHTFAKTVALKNVIPLETVQMMMGHTKISTGQWRHCKTAFAKRCNHQWYADPCQQFYVWYGFINRGKVNDCYKQYPIPECTTTGCVISV